MKSPIHGKMEVPTDANANSCPIPHDVFEHIVTAADLYTLNALARSCQHLAIYVAARASSLATARIAKMYLFDENYEEIESPQLANGTKHGRTHIRVDDESMRIDYVRGIPTYWSLIDYSEPTILHGHADVAYHLRIDNICEIDETHTIRVNRKHCRTYINLKTGAGQGHVTVGDLVHAFDITAGPLTGYLVDGNIATERIDSWIQPILPLVAPMDTFAPKRICIYVESPIVRAFINGTGVFRAKTV